MLRTGTTPSTFQALNSERSKFDTLFERQRQENQLAAKDDALLANLLPMTELKLGREITIEELKQMLVSGIERQNRDVTYSNDLIIANNRIERRRYPTLAPLRGQHLSGTNSNSASTKPRNVQTITSSSSSRGLVDCDTNLGTITTHIVGSFNDEYELGN